MCQDKWGELINSNARCPQGGKTENIYQDLFDIRIFNHTAAILQASSSENWLDWLTSSWLPARNHVIKTTKAILLIVPDSSNLYKELLFLFTSCNSTQYWYALGQKLGHHRVHSGSCMSGGYFIQSHPPSPSLGQQCTINAGRQRYWTSVCSGLCDIYCHINAPKEAMHDATPARRLLIQITGVTAMLARPSGTSSYITRVWKWWNGLAELLHYQRMIASAQTGGSFFTLPQETKKRYGWMIGTHHRETTKANTHWHKNNIKEILIFREFASLSRTFKHKRRPENLYQKNLLVVSQDVIKAVKNH